MFIFYVNILLPFLRKWKVSTSLLSYRFEFKGIIDYIFYSKQSMVPLGLLGPLSADWFKEHKVVGCPHPHVPSGKIISTKNKMKNKNSVPHM